MRYQIRREAERFEIANWHEDGAKGPATCGWLDCVNGDLHIRMRCYETDPLTVYTHDDDPVYTDSCMEIFVDCMPRLNKGYLNLEMNAAGASLCAFGPDRQNRVYLAAIGLEHPHVTVTKTDQYWQVDAVITKELIGALYGVPFKMKKGDILRGNFYKCAENTERPYWGSWAPVGRLDFHQPDRFGEWIVEEEAK